jgi:hypothetical protein
MKDPIFQIYGPGYRGILNVIAAKSPREALDKHFNDTYLEGAKRTFRANVMTVTLPNGSRRQYKAVKT